jgi:hypothetical protein
METRRMTKEKIQATGSYDGATNEYILSISCGALVVSFDFLKEDDIREILSCLTCMLPFDETEK